MITLDIVTPVVEESKDYVNGLDTMWVLLGAILVFWMQPGFALVEAGLTQSKNTANILMKNFVDFMFGSVLYWILGFSIMYGTEVDLPLYVALTANPKEQHMYLTFGIVIKPKL